LTACCAPAIELSRPMLIGRIMPEQNHVAHRHDDERTIGYGAALAPSIVAVGQRFRLGLVLFQVA
jgi:hypothetical protein